MSFDWGQYIKLAEELIIGSPDDAKLRSSTSRAYYGAFISCRNYKGYNSSTINIHETVINLYKCSDIMEEMSIGNFLSNLRKHRNDADYDGTFKPNVTQSKKHIQMANTIIDLLEKIKAED